MKRLLLTHLSLAFTLAACQGAPTPAPVTPAANSQQASSQPQAALPAQPTSQAASSAPLEPGNPSRPTPVLPKPNASAATPASIAPSAAAKPAGTEMLQARNYNTETLIVGLRAPAGEAEARAIAQRHALRLDRYLGSLRSAVYATDGQNVPAVMQALKAEAQLEFVEADQIAVQPALSETAVDGGFGVLAEGDEESPSPETSPSPSPSPSPSASAAPAAKDPYFAKQYSLGMLGVTDAWVAFPPDLPAIYTSPPPGLNLLVTPFAQEALVGVIDAGMAVKHVELAQTQRLEIRGGVRLNDYDAYSREQGFGKGDVSGLNYFKSSYKQGTHSAGLIAAQANNKYGIAGIAPRARVIPIKVVPDIFDKIKALFAPKDDTSQVTQVSVLADAITWAVDREAAYGFRSGGVDVLLIDTPVTEPSEVLKRAIDYALSREVLVVVPVGDKPKKADPDDKGYCLNVDADADLLPCGDSHATKTRVYNYLATLKGVIAVGAVDKDGKLADFSATGPFVSVVAPGVDVIGPVPGLISNNSYSLRSGTAVAAAQVAGVLALVIGADKWPLFGSRFRQYGTTYKRILEDTARDLGPSGYDPEYGHGLVNAGPALSMAETMPNDDMKL